MGQHKYSQLSTEAVSLIRRALNGLDDRYGYGAMTCTAYDTAWVSLISKEVQGEKRWAFPQCFQYILDNQSADGSWGRNPRSQIDGILNTAASLLSLKRHLTQPLNLQDMSDDLAGRIEKAVVSLRLQLLEWDVAATTHVGFEIIVPAMLRYLQQEDNTFVFDFDGRKTLGEIHAAKMSRFKPELMYGTATSTALHSLESFIGLINFDKLSHHLVHGSMMASPSSTAAYLMNVSKWDYEAEEYLYHVIASGAGDGTGGVPSAYPSMHFEYTWILSTLFRAGFAASDLRCPELHQMEQVLVRAFESGSGVIGFAPFLPADVDDTAKGIVSLVGIGHSKSVDGMIQTFETDDHFRTYVQERDSSFSANCNALSALLCQSNVAQYSTQILKTVCFLCNRWWSSDGNIRDKWNLSNLYSSLLVTQTLVDLLVHVQSGVLESVLDQEMQSKVFITLFQAGLRTLLETQDDGSWNHSVEETAYGVLILSESKRLSSWADLLQPLNSGIERGIAFIRRHRTKLPYMLPIWIEKVSYASSLLTDCYVVAALNAANSPYGSTVVNAGLAVNHEAGKGRNLVKLFQQTPLFSQTPVWQIRASLVESVLFQPLLHARRLDIFPRNGMEEDKYFDIIPFTWTSCNNRHRTFAPTAFIYDMMIISFLNYQADEFMEVVAGAAFEGRASILRSRIDGIFLNEKVHANNSNESHCGNGDNKTPSSDVLLPLHKFITHVTSHPAVVAASAWDRVCMKRELHAFLHAHVTQNEDNALFRHPSENRSSKYNPESHQTQTSHAWGQNTFFQWVRTTSADHTSCPYSFYFVSCWLSSFHLSGAECFPTVHEKYLAAATCRHLASMCRMYNDYGSIARDAAENNLNAVNFPEYNTSADIEDKKQALFELAQYERSCLNDAKTRLTELSDQRLNKSATYAFKARLMAIWQMFCDVTDLYGQIYVLRDIASRMAASAVKSSKPLKRVASVEPVA